MKYTMKTVIPVMILLFIFLSGCIDNNVKQSNVTEDQQNEDKNMQQTQVQTGLENSKDAVELAKKDAIARFNLSESDIKIDSVIPVEWTDTSLGYPEPGKEPGTDYSIETIAGYTIFISAKGKTYEYHSDFNRIVPPPYPFPDLEDMPRVIHDTENVSSNILDIIKKDINSKYNVPEQEIIIVKITPVTWPDASLGYPKPGMSYAQVLTPGFTIFVKADNKVYEYHTSIDRVVAPPV